MQENARRERQFKPFEELTIADDFMFGKVMREPERCRRLLEIILNIRIREVVMIENEKTIKPDYDGRGIRLDIYAEDDACTVYNVEMQTRNEGDLPKRSRYYQSLIDINILEKGLMPENLRNSLVIFICTFDLFGRGESIYTFENRCRQHPDLVLNDETVKMFVNTKGCCLGTTDRFAALMNYFNGNGATDAFTREVEEAVERVKQRVDLSVEYMAWNAMKANLLKEGRQEGLKEGRQEGLKEGRQEGLKEGRKEGLEEGVQKGAAINLIGQVCRKIAKDCSVEEIADMLEEDSETIRRICQVAEKYAPEYDAEKIYEELNLK